MAKAEPRDRLPVSGDTLIERAASRACTVFLGFGVGAFLCGALAWSHSLLDPLPRTSSLVIVIALVTAGMVPAVAFRLAFVFSKRGGGVRALLSDQVSEGRTAWLVTGGSAFATGLAAVLVVVAIPLIDSLYAWTLRRALWLPVQRGALEALLVFVAVGTVGGAVGLIAASLSPLFSDSVRPDQSRSLAAGTLFGGAFGVMITARVVLPMGSARQAMLLAAAAWFAVSIICFLVISGARSGRTVPRRETVPPPESAGLLEPIIVGGLACWGAAIGLSGSVCARVAAYEQAVGAASSATIMTAWLLWLCAGVTLASVIKPTRRHSAAGCGFALWLSGVASAGAAGVLVMVAPDVSLSLAQRALVVRPAAVAVAMCGLFAGLALPYVKRALMRYGGGHPMTLADFLSAVLVGAGVGAYAGGAWFIDVVGVVTVQCLCGLLCIAVGGVLLLNERSGTKPWRVCRGVAVFGSLAALGVLFPQWVRSAVTRPDGLASAMRGRAWLIEVDSKGNPVPGSVQLASFDGGASAVADPANSIHPISEVLAALCFSTPGRRACVIGADAGPITAWADAGFRELDHWPHDTAAENMSDGAHDPAVIRYTRHDRPAIGAWRAWRQSHDLIVLQPIAETPLGNAPIWTVESFARLQNALGPGGRLVVMLPAARSDAAIMAMVANGLVATTHGEVYWRSWPLYGSPEQHWFVSCNVPVDRDWEVQAILGGWRPAAEITTNRPVELHAFRTPRLGQAHASRAIERHAPRTLESAVAAPPGHVR